ncbi:MAG: 3-oxoadipate enol-lactonase [Saprospiraceae bacterium]|nr:3-oxoadipate enol-lactonase [Lewinella sp.]
MAFVNRGTLALYYRWLDQKRDKNLVLINSLGTNLSIWDGLLPLIQNEFNVLCFDKRGHGLSSTEEGKVSIDDYADDVIFLMDHLGIKKTSVLGLSIGGLITYSLASRYPERIDRLIFSNTGAKLGTADSWNERINIIREGGIAAMSNSIIARWLSSDFRQTHPAETAGYTNMLERNTNLGYIQACAAIRDADYHRVLQKVDQPALFIGGSEDVGTTAAFVRAEAAKISAKAVIINGVGHLPCIEAPERVARLILEFCVASENTSLYERGMQTRRAVLGDAHVDRAEANKTDFDRDFQEYIVNSAWGSIWSRPQLTKRERSMITIALLAALGHEAELEMHLRATRNTGASVEDVKEVLLHTGIYAGVPVTNGAMKIAKKIFDNQAGQKDE